MEKCNIIVPYIYAKAPPRRLDIPKMLVSAKKELSSWVDSLKPKFKVLDGLHLESYEEKDDGLHLSYSVVRNKYKNKEG